MTREEWNEVLATEPATRNQVGAVLRECDRLHLGDRAERLAVCAALLGLDELGSTADLVMGQAGSLYRMLLDVRDRAELPDVTAAAVDDEDQGDEDSATGRVSFADVITRVAAALWAALGDVPASVITEPDCTDSHTEGTRS